MSQRFRVLEQIAFLLVVMFGLICFAVVVYGYSPRARHAVHAVIETGRQFPAPCSSPSPDSCVAYLIN